MIKLSVKKSKRLESLMNNETWLMRFYRIFAEKFSKLWNKEAGSDREWVKTGGARTRNFGFVKVKPHPTKLTVRTGRLIKAATDQSPESKTTITTKSTGFEIYRRLTVPYANRQEKQLGAQRAYMLPSAEFVQATLAESILQKSLNEALK